MVKAINEQDYAGIGKDFAQTMADFFPLEKQEPFFKDLSAQYGKIKTLEDPRLVPPDQAVFVAQCERGKLDITVWLDDDDKVIGLLFLPHKPSIPVSDRNQTELSLPFRGRWLVIWGGDTKDLNQHHDVPNQRFAFDFLGVDEQGKTRKGKAHVNEDYFAYGREILASADGAVTDVIAGVSDNVPGSMNPYSALGNAVFIQHRENEISVLAHLKLGSVKVKVGDKVKAGQLIGLCGNSGNSSEPHLHYHLQNTPIIQDATGIKCCFQKVILPQNGKSQARTEYSPIKGEIIVAE
jgi:murein DD-endopeptidase MepM/ murein hydrolase activator NlpD